VSSAVAEVRWTCLALCCFFLCEECEEIGKEI
jgi:hypothetical protein